MNPLPHQILHGCAEHLMHLLIPVQGIAQVNHAVEQQHVRASIHSAFPNHQILLGQFTGELPFPVDHGQTSDVMFTQQRHGLLQLGLRCHAEHWGGHHIADRLLKHHGTQATARILSLNSPWRIWADRLTLIRAVAGLPLLLCLLTHQQGLAWVLLLTAGLTDALDGWMARRAGGGSSWGARLDPLADKLLITAPLLWLAADHTLPLWAVWLLMAREMLISGWRRDAVDGAPASVWGKAKTVLQFTSLILLLWPAGWGSRTMVSALQGLGWWLFWPSLVMALHSALGYLKPHRSELHHR